MLELYSLQFPAMGSLCVVHLYATDGDKAILMAQTARAEVQRIEERYSRYRAESILSRINWAAERGASITVDDETAALLDYAFACHKKSGGLFDITSGLLRKAWDFTSARLPGQETIAALLPLVGLDKVGWERPNLIFSTPGMELDFGGIGKEYAADRAAAVCRSMGIEHGLVDLGGDIRVIGPHPSHEPWEIKIRHPRNPDAFLATVAVERGAVASSGDYERFMEVEGRRYCHILNPQTGWPVSGLVSVSVLTDQCLVAGSVSTMAMLQGREGVQWLKGLGVPYGCLDEDGRWEGTLPFRAEEAG